MPTQRPPISLLSVVANIERHKIASGDPFLLLLCMQYPGTTDPTATQQYVRLVRDNNPITFDAGDGNGPQVYTPFNFSLGEISISSTGAVPELELKASNVMRALQSTLEQYAGAVGANLTLYVVNTANPAGEPELAMNFTVKQSVCDAKLVTMKLGASSPMRRLFPLFMYRPNYCAWQYMGTQCGYTTTAIATATTAGSATVTLSNAAAITAAMMTAGVSVTGPGIPKGTTLTALSGTTGTLSAPATATAAAAALSYFISTCSKTIDGTTGCQVHFPSSPLRGLFFPGIDSNGAAVASVA